MLAECAIGVFDSGIGGLSVLRELQSALPHERFVYWADSANAPYGERGDAFVQARSHAAVQVLRDQHHVKAVVVACNTATAASIDGLRLAHPDVPIVGIEPALKPAVAACRSGHIGVLATRGTLNSARFQTLAARVADRCRLHLQACDGLAEAIERSAGGAPDQENLVRALIDRHLDQLGALGGGQEQIDTLVLGCTHYPLAWPMWVARVGTRAGLINPSAAVARQLQRVLVAAGALAGDSARRGEQPRLTLISTGDLTQLQTAARRWAHAL